MLRPGSNQMTGPVIASGLRSGDHLALTAEPAAGSNRPTAPMMLYVVLERGRARFNRGCPSGPAPFVVGVTGRHYGLSLRRQPVKYMLIHCIDESAERARRPEDLREGAPSIESWLAEMEGRVCSCTVTG